MPKVESGFNALQDRILFAILQGNANLLEQLLQSQLGKTAFMRVYKDNFWFMDSNSTAIQTILNSLTAMQTVLNSSTAMRAVVNSLTVMYEIANSSETMQKIMNNNVAREMFFSSPYYVGLGIDTYANLNNANLKNLQTMQAIINSSTAMQVIANSSTAMQAIANSSTAMQAIANSSTAMQVIANSSTAMQAIANSSTAMQAIILSQTALDIIFANTSARDIFISSTALSSKEVPQMTSNTSPEGEASASSVFSSTYDAYKAFDKSTSCWLSASNATTNQWVRYSFVSPVFVHTVRVTNYSSNYYSKNIKIQCSTNGSDWIDCSDVITLPNNTTEQIFYVNKSGYFAHWRIFVIDGYSTTYVGLQEVNFIGFLQS
ncbi:MAG: discoidin domain-containing protein [Candidatus Aenigmatarchaeota archaeon]